MKTTHLLLILLLASSLVVAQPVQAPVVGGSIDQLTRVIQNNTEQSLKTQKTLEEMNGKINETMTSWSGSIVFGVSLFMLLIYLCILWVDRYRKKINAKHHEELIKQLETEAELKLKENNKRIEEINGKLEFLLAKLSILGPITIPEKPKQNMRVYLSFFLGVLFMLLLRKAGVF